MEKSSTQRILSPLSITALAVTRKPLWRREPHPSHKASKYNRAYKKLQYFLNSLKIAKSTFKGLKLISKLPIPRKEASHKIW